MQNKQEATAQDYSETVVRHKKVADDAYAAFCAQRYLDIRHASLWWRVKQRLCWTVMER